MRKHLKQFPIAVIVLIFISCILYLQYGIDIDASGSYYSGDTLSFNVTLNQLWFNSSTQKDIETNILKKYNDNSFHSVRFSTDLMHPKQLRISVYLNKSDIMHSDPIFTFSPDI
jgi:hypothetical protein